MKVNSILHRIFCLRFDSGYTQQDVADYLHISRVSYCYIENGRRELKIWHVMRLSRLFNVSTDYILFGNLEE